MTKPIPFAGVQIIKNGGVHVTLVIGVFGCRAILSQTSFSSRGMLFGLAHVNPGRVALSAESGVT